MLKRLLITFLFLNFLATSNFAQDNFILNFEQFLSIGPVCLTAPVSIEASREYDNSELLKFELFDLNNIWPSEGEIIKFSGNEFKWKKSDADAITKSSSDISICYLAAYVTVDRFTELKFEARSNQMLSFYVDNNYIGQKKKFKDEPDSTPGKFSKKLELETGKHLFLIKTIDFANSEADWSVEASLTDIINSGSVKISLDPIKFTDISNLLDDPKIKDVSISANGKIASVSISKRNGNKSGNEKWLEFYDAATGKLIRSLRGMSEITNIDWAPKGTSFAYTTREKDGTTLWISNFELGTNEPVLSGIKDFSNFYWAPDASFIIYSISKELKKYDPDLKKYDGWNDRFPWGNQAETLYKLNIEERNTTRLTFGNVSTSFNSISPDAKKIVFTVNEKNMKERPFEINTLYLMELSSHKIKKIHISKFGISATWSPDGNSMLIKGSPTTFGTLGLDIPEDITPNDYEGELYIYNLTTEEILPITKNFDPAVRDAYWLENNQIYISTTDKTCINIYKYSVDANNFELVNLGVEAVENIDFSTDGKTAVFKGSSANVHPKAFITDLEKSQTKLLLDADKEKYDKIKLGNVEEWIFKTETGKPVQGRINFPPDFDHSKKYPVIVHYYAGTSPMSRNFEGRYPENIWAANGYIVYTVTPGGSYGFGQKQAAQHVNDWGEITAKEIIEATKELIKTNDFIDANKIGCIGASYGGFETMNIITKTNIYSAAIAHAGISALSSYWGEGYWGFDYSTVASANSYPWNNKQLYVEHSPLFNADKISTPILLLHGDADTNVPVGESYQMYAALKILNKDVEMVTVKDLDHHIMEYNKRKKWTKTILAYFDWKLKGQPEWWNNLYQSEN